MPFEHPDSGKKEKGGVFEAAFLLESRSETVNEVEQLAERHLADLGWTEDESAPFLLAIREAVTNAIVHGNLEVAKEGPDDQHISQRIHEAEAGEKSKRHVDVTFRFAPDEAEVTVVDQGRFLPTEDDVAEAVRDFSEKPLATSGRGIGFINEGADQIEFFPGGIRFSRRRVRDGF